ncbi:MAG: hypothetical protein R6V12_08185 [Candidatus Hydrogenedentota bacterium]
MMAARGNKTRLRGLARRWGALLVVFLFFLVFVLIDKRVKHSGDTMGFCPSEAACAVLSTDFPAFCSKLAATDAAERFMAKTPRPFDSFELAVRKATGVRPTPLRWSIWLGPRFVASRWNNAYGVCVHPGLVLRLVHTLRTLCGARPNGQGLHTFAEHYYAWREGFLIVSASPDYVLAAMESPPLEALSLDNEPRLCVRWPDGTIQISAEESIPVKGMLDVDLNAGGTLSLHQAWPESTFFSVTAHNAEDTLRLWEIAQRSLQKTPLYQELVPVARTLWKHWALDAPPENWSSHVAEFSAAFMGIDTRQTFPVPEWAAMMRPTSLDGPFQHPWESVIAPLAPIDYAWEGRQGVIATLLGEKFAVCLAKDNERWMATSQRELMTHLLAVDPPRLETDADVVLQVNWQAMGRKAEELLRKAGELELIPEMNVQGADVYLGKYARSVAELGRLEIFGEATESGLAFRGTLVSHEDEEVANQ